MNDTQLRTEIRRRLICAEKIYPYSGQRINHVTQEILGAKLATDQRYVVILTQQENEILANSKCSEQATARPQRCVAFHIKFNNGKEALLPIGALRLCRSHLEQGETIALLVPAEGEIIQGAADNGERGVPLIKERFEQLKHAITQAMPEVVRSCWKR